MKYQDNRVSEYYRQAKKNMRNGFQCILCGCFVRKNNIYAHPCVKQKLFGRKKSAFQKLIRFPLRTYIQGKVAYCQLCHKTITRTSLMRHLNLHQKKQQEERKIENSIKNDLIIKSN